MLVVVVTRLVAVVAVVEGLHMLSLYFCVHLLKGFVLKVAEGRHPR